MAFERVIVHDVFDHARRECSTHRVAICGASLGAYHAANIAFRHPDLISHLISLSGAFDISDFFDGYYDDNVYFNSPYDYLPNLPDPWRFNHMGLILGTGEWDNTRHESLRMSGFSMRKRSITGSMTGSGAAMIGTIGATCCRFTCPKYEGVRSADSGIRAVFCG